MGRSKRAIQKYAAVDEAIELAKQQRAREWDGHFAHPSLLYVRKAAIANPKGGIQRLHFLPYCV